jgi:hypothetical protein
MDAVIKFIGALLITYFLSRGFRRLGLVHPPLYKLLAAHVLSGGVIFVLLFTLRYPLFILHKNQFTIYIIAQLLWLIFDLYRARIAIWRAPVVETTGSSAKRP